MQDVGEKETRRMGEALSRKVEAEGKRTDAEEFQTYSRRLVKDLEAKGIVRTAVEAVNLALHAADQDVLQAECIRTFPTVTFPASLLLKREEIETLKTSGTSVIAAVYHNKGLRRSAYVEAPFDLLYGFRGERYNVDLLSPYEMLLHWSMVHIDIPGGSESRAAWTELGKTYAQEAKDQRIKPRFEAGKHYIALEDTDRILLPNIEALWPLRHCWCWERRWRLHIPTWSFSKVPRSIFSPEENARLLSVYLRPWTLDEAKKQRH